MNPFDNLLLCSGTWEGLNRVQPTPADPINESPSRLIIAPLLRDTFLRIDQTWSWNNQPQSGSFLIGHSPHSLAATIHWIDTWHNGTRVMPLIGQFDPAGILTAQGHFSVKNSPDWGWRIQIHPGASHLQINMFCLNPHNNNEEGWVQSEYHRLDPAQ